VTHLPETTLAIPAFQNSGARAKPSSARGKKKKKPTTKPQTNPVKPFRLSEATTFLTFPLPLQGSCACHWGCTCTCADRHTDSVRGAVQRQSCRRRGGSDTAAASRGRAPASPTGALGSFITWVVFGFFFRALQPEVCNVNCQKKKVKKL